MKKNSLIFVLIIALTFFQYLFLDFLDIRGISPDLFIIFIIYLGFRISPTLLIWIAFLLGLIQDLLFNTTLIGLTPIIKILFTFFLLKLLDYKKALNPFLIVSGLIGLIIIYHNLFDKIYFLQVVNPDFSIFINYSLPQSVYTISVLLLLNLFLPIIDQDM